MPRTKKQVSAGNKPASKKATTSGPVDVSTAQWEWEGDKGVWTAFAEDVNEEISEAFRQGDNDILLTVPGGAQMKVIFDKMVQKKNKKTGWDRRLRLCLKDGEDFYAWEWEDEHKKWNPYSCHVCQDLENARGASSTTLGIEASQRSYTVDITKMEQTNDDTDVVRNIRRKKTEAKQPTSITPEISM